MLPSAESIQILVPIVSILFLILSFRRNIFGVIAYLIIINSSVGVMYPELGAIRFELIAAILIFVSIYLSGGINIFSQAMGNPIQKSMILLFILVMLSVPQAVDPGWSWTMGGYEFLRYFLLYIMIVCSIQKQEDLVLLLWAVVLATMWVAYEPITNFIAGTGRLEGYGEVALGSYGVAAGHVALANTMCQTIPIAFYLAYISKRKVLAVLLTIALCSTVLLTKSRGGFVGLCTIALGLMYLSENRKKIALVLAIFFVVSIPLTGDVFIDHMATILNGIHGSRSSHDRYIGLINGIEMAMKRPLLGVGIACYPVARGKYFHYWFYSHNLYGELIGELGLASIAWFVWIFRVLQRSQFLKKTIDRESTAGDINFYALNAIQLALFTRLILGNFSHCTLIWFWSVMAAMTVSIERINTNTDTENSERQSLNEVEA